MANIEELEKRLSILERKAPQVNTRLTDKTNFTDTVANNDVLHMVDVSDTTSNPAGTSFKIQTHNLMPIPTNTVYVRQQSDFGATTTIGGNLYFTLVTNTQYIILRQLTMTIGFAPLPGGIITITSAYLKRADINWTGFTDDVIIQSSGAALLILKDLKINNIAGTTEFLLRAQDTTNILELRRCEINAFQKAILIENATWRGKDNTFFNPTVSTPTKSLIHLQTSSLPAIAGPILMERNFISNNAGIPTITIESNTVGREFIINNNYCDNADAAFIDIDIDSLTTSSRVVLENNTTTNPQVFFAGGSLDMTDGRVDVWGNSRVRNSRGFMDATDNSAVSNEITISTMGVPVQVSGRIIVVGDFNTLFTVTHPGDPNVPTVTCNVKGSSGFMYACNIGALLDAAMDDKIISLGLLLNGTPIPVSFVPALFSANPHTYDATFILQLLENDELTFAVRNDTDNVNIDISSLQISIWQIN